MNRQKKQDNIKRHEIKFAFTNKDENKLLQNYKLKKIFPDRIVESVYYDTSEFKFFHLSEEGVTPRIKIRMRGYNNGLLENLEIKKTGRSAFWIIGLDSSSPKTIKAVANASASAADLLMTKAAARSCETGFPVRGSIS